MSLSTMNPIICTNLQQGYTSTATSTTPLTLISAGTHAQYITGSVAQNIMLPPVNNPAVANGFAMTLSNKSSASASIYAAGAINGRTAAAYTFPLTTITISGIVGTFPASGTLRILTTTGLQSIVYTSFSGGVFTFTSAGTGTAATGSVVSTVISLVSTLSASTDNMFICNDNTAGNTGNVNGWYVSPKISSITGTVNQVAVIGSGAVVLSTPQDIATTSSPSFANLTLTGKSLFTNGIAIGDSSTSTVATGIAFGKGSSVVNTSGIAIGGNAVSGQIVAPVVQANVPLYSSGNFNQLINSAGNRVIFQTLPVVSTFNFGYIRMYIGVANTGNYICRMYSGIVTSQPLNSPPPGLVLLGTISFTSVTTPFVDIDFTSLSLVLTPGNYTVSFEAVTSNINATAILGYVGPDLAQYPDSEYPNVYNPGYLWPIAILSGVSAGINSVAIGQSATVSANNSIVIGASASSSIARGVALGQGAIVSSATNALAFGVNTSSVQPGNFGINVNNSTYQLPLYSRLYDATVTAGAITTLTAQSACDQYFSGTQPQNVSLPHVSTLNNTANVSGGGYKYTIHNGSTGLLTIGNGITILDSPTTALPASTLFVRSISGFPSSGSFSIQTIANGAQTISYTSTASFSGATYGFSQTLPLSVITFQSAPTGIQGAGYIAFPTVSNGIQIVQYTFVSGTAIFNCTGGTGTIAAGSIGTQAVFFGCTGGTGSAARGTTLGRFIATVPAGVSQDIVLVNQTGVATTDWYVPSYASTSGVTSISGGATGLTPSVATNGAVTLGGVLGTSSGGTGLNTSTATNGQLLIGTGTGLALSTLTAGTGITITNTSGAITIASAGGIASVTGTTNQVNAVTSLGAVTVSLPNQINFSSQFVSIGAGGTAPDLAGLGGVCIGQSAAINVTGIDNVVIGGLTGQNLSTGTRNVLLGYGAAQNYNGNDLVCIGQGALAGVTTSIISSTFVGSNAAKNLTSGSQNTFVGNWTNPALTTGSSNTFIGTDTGSVLASGSTNTLLGTSAGAFFTSGDDNTFLGVQAGTNLTSGSNNVCIGRNSQPSTATSSNEFVLGNGAVTVLRCQQSSISALSDQRDKTDIIALDAGLDFVNKLTPVRFTWNTRDGTIVNRPDTGFIAQQLRQLQMDTGINIPGLVYDANPDRIEASYGKLIPVFARAIQDLSAQNATLTARLAAIEARLP